MATVTIDPGPNPTIPYKTDLVGSDNVPLLKIDKGGAGVSSPVTDANPLPVAGTVEISSIPQIEIGGTSKMNLTEVDSVTVSLGQKAEASGIPVTLATEQDATKTDAVTYGNFHGVGVPWLDSGAETNGWKPWPTDGDGEVTATPKAAIFARDVVSEQPASVYSTTTTPSASGGVRGLIARAINYVIDTGGSYRTPLSDLTGRLLINIDRLANTLIATGNGATDAGTMRVTLASDSTGVLTATPNNGYATGTITTSTGTVQLSNIGAYSGVGIFIRGTYNNINLTPEVSDDGIAWSGCSISRQDTPQIQQTTGALTNTIRSWIAPTLGANYFRIRATTWTSGTMGVALRGVTGAIPTALTSIASGTVTISGAVTLNSGATIALTGAKAGGGTPYTNLDVNATGALVQGSQTSLTGLYAFNSTGATIYLKVYNKATAGTSADTPVQVYPLPAGQGRPLISAVGLQLSLGLSFRCTTGVAHADNTSPAANGCVLSAIY